MDTTTLEIAGTLAFSLSGAILAVEKRLDVIGGIALALAAGFAGGLLRDVLLGTIPPTALRDPWLLLLPILAVALSLLPRIDAWLPLPMLVFDAIGLGLFATVGAARAAEAGLGVVPAAFLGVLTAVGGGVLRDVLVRDIPVVFTPNSGLYAIPAAAGAAAVALADRAGLGSPQVMAAIALLVTALRLVSMRLGWRTPPLRMLRGRRPPD